MMGRPIASWCFMITKFEVNNFKCLKDLKLDLSPFSVCIGPNDSGKSSFLDALHLLGKTIEEPYQQVFTGHQSIANLLWKRAHDKQISWNITGVADTKSFT